MHESRKLKRMRNSGIHQILSRIWFLSLLHLGLISVVLQGCATQRERAIIVLDQARKAVQMKGPHGNEAVCAELGKILSEVKALMQEVFANNPKERVLPPEPIGMSFQQRSAVLGLFVEIVGGCNDLGKLQDLLDQTKGFSKYLPRELEVRRLLVAHQINSLALNPRAIAERTSSFRPSIGASGTSVGDSPESVEARYSSKVAE